MDDLYQFVQAGVQRQKGRWQALADASGVSYSWITKFGAGRVPNAGHKTLEKVAAALKDLPQ